MIRAALLWLALTGVAVAGPIRPGQSPGARIGGFTSFGAPAVFNPLTGLTNRMRSNAGGTALIDSVGGATPTKSAGSTFVSDAGAPAAAPYILRQTTSTHIYTLPVTPQATATYATWIYITAAPSASVGVMGEAKASSTASFMPFSVYMLTTRAVRLSHNGNANLLNTSALSLNAWHQVAVTFECAASTCTIRLYADGNLAGTATGIAQRDITGTRITNGYSSSSDAPGSAGSLIGDYQELDVYAGTALSSGDIQSLYNLGRNGW